jgi:hypothetical protein
MPKHIRKRYGLAVPDERFDEVRKNLSTSDMNKLRASKFYRIMSKAVTNDLKKTYLNLAFVALTLVPGPSGAFVVPALVASYFLRWDKDAVEARRKVRELIKNDVSLEEYKEVIKMEPNNQDKFWVDVDGLLHMKKDRMKKSSNEVFGTARGTIKKFNDKFVCPPLSAIGKAGKYTLGKAVGEERAEKACSAIFNSCAGVKNTVVKSGLTVGKKIGNATNATGRNIKESFNATSEVTIKVMDNIQYGWAVNKENLRHILKPGG